MQKSKVTFALLLTTTALFPFSQSNATFNADLEYDQAIEEALRRSLAPSNAPVAPQGQQPEMSEEEQIQLAMKLSMESSKSSTSVSSVAKPLLQQDLSKEEAINLIKYIFGQKSAVIIEAGSRISAFEFFDSDGFISFFEFPSLEKSTLHASSTKKLQEFCEEKAIHFEDAQVLLGRYLEPLNQSMKEFDQTYTQFKTLIESQDFQTSVLPALKKAANWDVQKTQEQITTDNDEAFKKLQNIDPRPFYNTLKGNLENLRKIGYTFPFLKAEDYLKTITTLLRTSGLPPKKRIDPNVQMPPLTNAFSGQPSYLPAQPMIPQKAFLSPDITDFQSILNQEIESRNNQFKQNPAETIMVYGKLIAQQHYPKLQDNIKRLSPPLKFRSHKNLESTEEILEFYNEVVKTLGYNNDQTHSIRASLKTSNDEHYNPYGKVYIVPQEQTKYDYMLTVANQVYHIYKTFKDNPNVKEEIEFLLQNFFSLLVDQAGKCQTGMVGRMFLAQKTVLDTLININNRI